MEKIYLISNPYTIPKDFKEKYPLSYNYYRFQTALENRNIGLTFVKQDKNYIFFQAYDKKTKNTSRIINMSYGELMHFNVRWHYQQIMEDLKL